MSENQKKIYISLVIISVFLSVVTVFSITWRLNRQVTYIESPKTESATVLTGEATLRLLFSPNTTFYDALIQAKNSGQIEFAGKNYPGLGFFVTDIGTLRAGGRKSLLYYINGKEATVGVSSYTLVGGDIIEWKLE